MGISTQHYYSLFKNKQNNLHCQHAIVIGGSIAGLVAAKVLSKHYKKVTIIERDSQNLSNLSNNPRRYAPQGNHLHALLKKGEIVLEELFPGICQDLQDSGSIRTCFGADVKWFHFGDWKIRLPRQEANNLQCLFQSRPLLESHVRHRVSQLKNVEFLYETSVTGFIMDTNKYRINGVNIKSSLNAKANQLIGNLIIDASGCGSHTPNWLRALGFNSPEEDRVELNLAYSTRSYRLPEDANRDWQAILVYNHPPHSKCIAGLYPVEGNRWLVTLGGYDEQTPPKDDASFMEFIRKLPNPAIYEALKDAEPLSEIQHYKFPKQRWRRYDKLKVLPDGLVVIGDALARFDPVFGQGMSVASESGLILEKMVKQAFAKGNYELVGFSKRFHRKVAKLINSSWLITLVERYRYSSKETKKPLHIKILQLYTEKIFRLSQKNPMVYSRFLKVMHMMEAPTHLVHPEMIYALLKESTSNFLKSLKVSNQQDLIAKKAPI